MHTEYTLADVARMIGTDVNLTTSDGWVARVHVTDAKAAYGKLRVYVHQGGPEHQFAGRWVDASRVTS